MPVQRSTIISLLIGLLFFGVSVLVYGLLGYSRVSRVFFFLTDRTLAISGEDRRVPRQEGLEGNIESYMDEWLLGPLELEHRPFFPRETKLTAVLLRGERLYMDFTHPLILLKDSEEALSPGEIVDMINRGITFNFPQIREIYISVEGEPLYPKEGPQ